MARIKPPISAFVVNAAWLIGTWRWRAPRSADVGSFSALAVAMAYRNTRPMAARVASALSTRPLFSNTGQHGKNVTRRDLSNRVRPQLFGKVLQHPFVFGDCGLCALVAFQLFNELIHNDAEGVSGSGLGSKLITLLGQRRVQALREFFLASSRSRRASANPTIGYAPIVSVFRLPKKS